MTDSLREQLLKLGFKKPEPVARPAPPAKPHGHSAGRKGNADRNAPQRPGQQRPGQQRPGQQRPDQQRADHDRSAPSRDAHKPGPQPQRLGQRNQAPRPNDARPQHRDGANPAQPARSQEEIDLARAYALRERQEREERETARKEAEMKARERKLRRQQLQSLVEGKALNDAEAELMRHFPHREKIKRVHVTQTQLEALNAGGMGVVQIEGRYLLVDREIALAVQAVFADALVLLPEPGSEPDDEIVPAPTVGE